jgi:hypothetical protein
LVAPYREIGAAVEKFSEIPSEEMPIGKIFVASGLNRTPLLLKGSELRAGIE